MHKFPGKKMVIKADGRSYIACTRCRKKKLKCSPSLTKSCLACAKAQERCSFDDNNEFEQALPYGVQQTFPQDSNIFIGNLNPASALLDDHLTDRDNVGIWANQASSSHALDGHLLAYLNAIEAMELPPIHICHPLIEIYFESVNTVFPLVDETIFRGQLRHGQAKVMVIQAMLISACRQAKALPHLYKQPPRQFAFELFKKLKALIYAHVDSSSTELVEALALASLHVEGPNGSERSSLFLQEAIHRAISLGLHLKSTTESESRLWWTLYSMDRLNACIHGRPLLINVADICKYPDYEGEGLGMLIEFAIEIQDKIIPLYRPYNTHLPPYRVRDWSQFIRNLKGSAGFQHIAQFIILVLKILGKRPSNSDCLADAKGILSMIDHVEFIQIPIVPYGLLLSLAVFFHQALASNHDEEHITNIKITCEYLQELEGTWWITGALSRVVLMRLENSIFINNDNISFDLGVEPIAMLFGEDILSSINYSEDIFQM